MEIEPNLLHECVAQMMLDELEGSRLDVYLIPCWGDYGDRFRRVAVERNPDWYRQLCDAYQSQRSRPRRRRHGDTKIKRRHTLRALREIASGRVATEYAYRIWPYVEERAARMLRERMETKYYAYYS
jgi:hypothetical protein